MGAYLTQPVTDKVSEDKAFKGMTYGASSMQGWRITQEDAHNCLTDFDIPSDTCLFAVYDGHGGSEVAQYCALYLPNFIKDLPEYEKGDLAECSKAAFLKFDETLVNEEVIKKLKVLAGDDDGGDEDESSATPCVRSEAEMLRAEANMPLDELLSKYDNLPPGIQTRNLRKSGNTASPINRAKKELSSDTEVGGSSDCVSSSDSNNSSIAISLESKLLTNGHADNENNLNKEKEIQDSLSCKSENDSEIKDEKDCEPSSSTDKLKSTTNESDSKYSLKESSEANCKTSGADLSSLTISSSSVGSSSNKSTGAPSCSSSSDSGITSSKEIPQSSSSSSNSNSNSDVGSSSSSGLSLGGSSSAVGSSSFGSSSSGDNSLPGSSSGVGSSSAGGSGSSSAGGSGSSSAGGSGSSSSDAGPSGSCSGGSNEKKLISIEFGDDDDDSEEEDDEDEEYADMESDDEDDEEEEEEEEVGEGEDEENADHPYMDMTNEEPGSDSGCTACLALLRGKKLIVANAGDSRCVLSRDGQAVELSFDHKPEDEIEKNRIEKAGGKVTADGRVNGGLNLSRALGDHWYKRNNDLPAEDQMISACPDIQTVKIDDNDEFIVLACDGIWNYLSSQEVVDYVRERLKSKEKRLKPSLICEELFDFCLAPNTFGDGTGCDNMTCIIIVLNPNKEPKVIPRKRSTDDIDTSQTDEVQLPKKPKVDEESQETDSTDSIESVSSVNK